MRPIVDNSFALLLTVPEAARFLRISRGLCYELIQRGELPALRLGRAIRAVATGTLVMHAGPGLPLSTRYG